MQSYASWIRRFSVSISRHMLHPHTHAVHTKCKCMNRAVVLVVCCMQTGWWRRYYGRSNARSLAGTLDARAFDPRRAAARAHKSRTLCPRRHDTQRFMNERQCRLPAALAYDCTRPSGPTACAEMIHITRDVIKLKTHALDSFYTRWCALE